MTPSQNACSSSEVVHGPCEVPNITLVLICSAHSLPLWNVCIFLLGIPLSDCVPHSSLCSLSVGVPRDSSHLLFAWPLYLLSFLHSSSIHCVSDRLSNPWHKLCPECLHIQPAIILLCHNLTFVLVLLKKGAAHFLHECRNWVVFISFHLLLFSQSPSETCRWCFLHLPGLPACPLHPAELSLRELQLLWLLSLSLPVTGLELHNFLWNTKLNKSSEVEEEKRKSKLGTEGSGR